MDNNSDINYTNFAQVYDELMDNIPYSEWLDFIKDILKNNNINDGLICELGCGTGIISEELSLSGYEVTGIDSSYEMLEEATKKKDANNTTTLYLNQDMREFELYGTMAAIISVCDSINYLTEPEDLLQVFKLVDNYLDPDGLFIFDFHPENYYFEVGESTIAESRDDVSFIWDNFYDEESHINELYLTLFLKEKGSDPAAGDLYRKYEEFHYQYGYTLSEIKALLKESGLIFEKAYNGYTNEEINDKNGTIAERIVIVARESGRKKA